MANAGFGITDPTTGAFVTKLEGDGDAKIGDSSGDVIQVTGSIKMNENLFFLSSGKIGIGDSDPSYKLSVGGSMEIGQYIYHKGDNNTFINFTDNRVRINAGGNNHIDCQDNSSAPHKVRINNGGNNIDFIIKDKNNNEYFTADASTSRVGIGTTTPSVDLEVDGTVNATTYQIGGTAINSTAAELNLLDASVTSEASDGAWAIVERIAKVTVDSNDYARSAGPVSLGVTIPDNAILTKYIFDCTQTFAAGDDGSEIMAVVDLGLYNASGKVFDFAPQANIVRTGASSAPYVAGTSQAFPLASANSKLTEALTAKIHVFDDGSGMLNSLDAGALDIYIYYIIGA